MQYFFEETAKNNCLCLKKNFKTYCPSAEKVKRHSGCVVRKVKLFLIYSILNILLSVAQNFDRVESLRQTDFSAAAFRRKISSLAAGWLNFSHSGGCYPIALISSCAKITKKK